MRNRRDLSSRAAGSYPTRSCHKGASTGRMAMNPRPGERTGSTAEECGRNGGRARIECGSSATIARRWLRHRGNDRMRTIAKHREVISSVPSQNHDRLKILIRHGAIERRVSAIVAQISRDFRGEQVHLIGVLKGAVIFLSDLVRLIRLQSSMDFIAVSSYGKGTQTSGQVRLTKDLDRSIEGLNVILVEDILDTGLTLNYLLRILPVHADYVGFTIPNEFVVGYGLDYAENYRNLKDICVLSLGHK